MGQWGRRTELQEVFPDHAVNKWLGHSGKVAEKHFLQLAEEHWGKAIESRTLTGSLITSHPETIKGNPETTKPSELLGSDGVRGAYDTLCNDPDGSRTRVTAVKGQCPRPLDDGAACLLQCLEAWRKCTSQQVSVKSCTGKAFGALCIQNEKAPSQPKEILRFFFLFRLLGRLGF